MLVDVIKRPNGSVRKQMYFSDDTRTKRSSLKECDINSIMAKYEKTGIIEHVKQFSGRYDDFTMVQDYHESLNQVMAAQEAFMTLPAQLRSRFKNDPAEFLEFVGNPDNKNEMISLGLVDAPTPEVEMPLESPEQLPT